MDSLDKRASHEPIIAYPTSGNPVVTLLPPSRNQYTHAPSVIKEPPREPSQTTIDGYVNQRVASGNNTLPYSRAHINAIKRDLLAPLDSCTYIRGCEPRDVGLL